LFFHRQDAKNAGFEGFALGGEILSQLAFQRLDELSQVWRKSGEHTRAAQTFYIGRDSCA